MRNFIEIHTREKGFALVTVLVSMLILVFLGIAAMMTSTTEKEIAGAEKIYKDTFYQADNGTSLAAEILEQNINCPSGFDGNSGAGGNTDALILGRVTVLGPRLAPLKQPPGDEADNPRDDIRGSRAFWQNTVAANNISDDVRDFYYAPYDPIDIRTPYNGVGDAPHTNFTVGGNTVFASGSALLQAAGYEGKGKGSGSGGTHIMYQIFSQHRGLANSSATVWMQWRHVSGTEGDCDY